jgi:hypothetical protein
MPGHGIPAHSFVKVLCRLTEPCRRSYAAIEPRDGAPRPKKLLDQVRDHIRLKNYSYRAEQSYVDWIKRFILFHNKRHPSEMGRLEIEAFLTYLLMLRSRNV